MAKVISGWSTTLPQPAAKGVKSDNVCVMRTMLALLIGTVLSVPSAAENIDAAVHVTGGANVLGTRSATFAAGFHIDPAIFPQIHFRSQTFETGLSYDHVQGRSGGTADFRIRVPVLRCYGWEFECVGKRFWVTVVPSVGERWGSGGLHGFAALQIQTVFDLNPTLACCRLAVGIQHRFPFDSTLRDDNAITIELRSFIMFRDRAPAPHRLRHHGNSGSGDN
jgi:hypothetical protein